MQFILDKDTMHFLEKSQLRGRKKKVVRLQNYPGEKKLVKLRHTVFRRNQCTFWEDETKMQICVQQKY